MPRSRRRDDDDTPRRKKSRRRDDDDEDEDEDDEEEDTPRRKKSRSIADDDDDDDDRPRKKSRRRDDDEDDEDDEDDRPRKKRKALKRSKKSAGGGPLLLILGLVGGFVLLAGGGFALWFFLFNDTPEKAYADYKDAFIKKDYGRLYDRLDKEGQAEFENMRPNPVIQATQSGKKGRELYIEMMKEIEGKAAMVGISRAEQERAMKETKLESVTVDGDNATLTLNRPNGNPTPFKMVKQDGRWRVKTGNQPGFRLR